MKWSRRLFTLRVDFIHSERKKLKWQSCFLLKYRSTLFKLLTFVSSQCLINFVVYQGFSLTQWMAANQVYSLPLSQSMAEVLKHDIEVTRFFSAVQCSQEDPHYVPNTDLGWNVGKSFSIIQYFPASFQPIGSLLFYICNRLLYTLFSFKSISAYTEISVLAEFKF